MITIDLADKLPSVHALWRSFRRTVVSVKFIGGRQCSKYSRISTTTATRQSVWTPEATKRTCHTQYSSAVDNRRMINSYRATWVRFPSPNPTKSTLTTQPNPSKQNRYSATLSNSFMSVISRSHERRPTQSKFNFVTYRIDNIVKGASDTSRQPIYTQLTHRTTEIFDPTRPNPIHRWTQHMFISES